MRKGQLAYLDYYEVKLQLWQENCLSLYFKSGTLLDMGDLFVDTFETNVHAYLLIGKGENLDAKAK